MTSTLLDSLLYAAAQRGGLKYEAERLIATHPDEDLRKVWARREDVNPELFNERLRDEPKYVVVSFLGTNPVMRRAGLEILLERGMLSPLINACSQMELKSEDFLSFLQRFKEKHGVPALKHRLQFSQFYNVTKREGFHLETAEFFTRYLDLPHMSQMMEYANNEPSLMPSLMRRVYGVDLSHRHGQQLIRSLVLCVQPGSVNGRFLRLARKLPLLSTSREVGQDVFLWWARPDQYPAPSPKTCVMYRALKNSWTDLLEAEEAKAAAVDTGVKTWSQDEILNWAKDAPNNPSSIEPILEWSEAQKVIPNSVVETLLGKILKLRELTYRDKVTYGAAGESLLARAEKMSTIQLPSATYPRWVQVVLVNDPSLERMLSINAKAIIKDSGDPALILNELVKAGSDDLESFKAIIDTFEGTFGDLLETLRLISPNA